MRKLADIVPVLVIVAASSILNNSYAQSDLKDIVLERKLKMKSMLRAYFPVLAVFEGKSTDLAKAAESAKKINDEFALSLALFVEDTAKGQVPGSRARPEIWSKPAEFNGAAEKLMSSIAKLIEISRSNNFEAFKEQFQVVEQACIGCHEFKPSGGGRFRFAR